MTQFFSAAMGAALAISVISGSMRPAQAQDVSGPNDELTQISTINALINGVYEGSTTVAELMSMGTFGIGTLNHLDGEMLAIDGVVYQATSSGGIHVVPQTAKTPFAVVTNFHADTTTGGLSAASYEEFQRIIDAGLPSENLFYAIKVTGDFAVVKARSVARQQPPYRPLTEVVKEQSVFEFQNTSGTLVGFRCPDFVQGVNVAAYHLHFLSSDKMQGGHVLGFSLEKGTVQVDILPGFRVLLPEDGPFMTTDLSDRNDEAIHKVEKIRK